MHHLFRLRHMGILTAVIGVGLIPLYAAPNLGAGESFAVLANSVTVTGDGTVNVNALNPGGGNGVVGAISPSIDPSATVNFAVTSANVSTGIAAADAVADALCAGPANGFPAAVGNTYTLTPSATPYRVAGDLALGAANTVEFNGAGDYTVIVAGDLDVDAATTFTLLNGASEANITWIVCGDGGDATGVTIAGGLFRGRVVSAENILVSAAAQVNGKLIATGPAGNVTFQVPGAGDTTNVNDAGTPPAIQVSSGSVIPVTAALPALDGTGTVADPYVITVGQTLSYSVGANDPDTDPVTLNSTGDGGLTGYVETDNDGNALPVTNAMAFANVSYSPTNADAGDHTITYTATDGQGAVASATVTIHVNLAPISVGTSGVSGEAPFFAGTTAGTAASPFVACVGGALTFDVTATDPDFTAGGLGTNTTTLDVSGETASFSFSPVNPLPTTENDGSITTTVTYSPTLADGGTTQTLTFTFTDELGATTTQDVVIFTSSLPTFSAPFVEPGPAVVTACVGQLVQFDINTTDADTTIPGTPATPEEVALYVEGTPVGAEHNPNFLGAGDFLGPDTDGDGQGGDLIISEDEDEDGDATDQTSRFEWTPMAGDEGTYLLTYTAEDAAGCTTSTTVTLVVTNPPTIAATNGGNAVTAGQVFTVCPDQNLSIPVTATDPDLGDVVALTATGAPGGSFTNTSGASPVTSTLSFTPTAGQAGQTFNVVVSATDVSNPSTTVGAPGVVQCDPTATLSFTIQVANVPQLSVTPLAGTTITDGVTNVCVGQAVNFRVRATDADANDSISLTQTSGLPATAFTPGLPANGNPVESTVSFTPAAAGQNVVTFTATDASGCTATTSVTINASAVPTLSIGSVSGQQSGAGTEANPYVVCATPATPFTFTVTGADTDVANTVTLSHTGALPGAMFTTPVGANPTSQTVSFSPTAGQGGQTFAVTFTATDDSGAPCSVSQTVNIRVTSLPVITATPSSITLCEGEAINFRVRATDADAGNVTIGVPTITNNAVEGDPVPPALTLTNTQTLPAAGNPVETVVTGTAPEVAADVTYTVTYTATDSDGCTSTQAVTITVMNSAPASISLSRTGGSVFGEQICYTAVVLDNCPAELGGPRRLAGIQVCFSVVGTTGNDGQFFATTNENGEAVFCLTPVFPGTLTVTAAIDQNGDCVADAGTTTGTDNVTVPAPVPNNTGTYITGHGKVDGSDPVFGTAPVIAQFSLDISPKANGTFKGKVNVLIPGVGTTPQGRKTNVKLNSTRIDSVTVTEGEGGRRAVIFGVMKVSGLSDAGLNGTRPFRVDAFDGGTPGIPNDRITMTLLDTVGGVAVGPFGGNLAFGRSNGKNPNDDIKIRSGIRGR